jgi:hypothetical protein
MKINPAGPIVATSVVALLSGAYVLEDMPYPRRRWYRLATHQT